MKDIIINIYGTQNLEGKNDNIIELTTEGKLEKVENDIVITYEESELTGMQGTTTEIILDSHGIVILDRRGTTNSHLIFEEGKKHSSYYDTNEGAFSMAVFANYVEMDIEENGGEIEVSYILEVNGACIAQNEIRVNFTIKE